MTPPTNPFPPEYPPDTAERIAAKRTAKLRAEAGLFADLVPPVTPDQVQDAAREQAERFAAAQARLEERAAAFRRRVAKMVAPDELAALDKRLKALPPTPEYAADFWGRVFKRLDADPWADV